MCISISFPIDDNDTVSGPHSEIHGSRVCIKNQSVKSTF